MGIERHKYRERQMTIQRTGGKWSARALMLYNLLFWASGVVLVIIGIWVQVDPRRSYVLRLVHLSEREPYLIWVAWICIITGVFTLLIGFVSCCAAVKRLRCMTATFILFLVVFFMANIAIATLALIYRDQFTLDYTKLYLTNMTQNRYSRDYWVQPLLDTIQFYLRTGQLKEAISLVTRRDYGVNLDGAYYRRVTADIDKLQYYGECCGVLGPSDWASSRWRARIEGAQEIEVPLVSETETNPLYPESCCTLIKEATPLIPVAKSLARCQRIDAPAIWRHSRQQCCGGTGPQDYENSFWFITNHLRGTVSWVPPSCCRQTQAARAWSIQPIDPMCITYHYNQTAFRSSVYVEGCYERLHKWLNDMTLMFVVLGFSFAAFMFVGIIISLCLCNSIRYYVQVEEY